MFRAVDIRRNALLKLEYKALDRDAMFYSLRGAPIWQLEANKNICHRVLL